MKNLLIVLTLVIVQGFPNCALGSFVDALTSQQLIHTGKDSFLKRCSGCHGEEADGKGLAAPMLNPRPRNLKEGAFKFRTTPYGVLPTVSDLIRTIDQGVLGTSMPSFRLVSEQEKLSLVAYIRSLRPEFQETLGEQVSMAFAPPPSELFVQKEALISAAKKGRAHYEKACMLCHGAQGLGDGPSAGALLDSTNRKIVPANLTKPYIKSGKRAQDIFKAISTGLDGTPMPGYADTFSAQERWEIVSYIFYLRGRESGIYGEGDKLDEQSR